MTQTVHQKVYNYNIFEELFIQTLSYIGQIHYSHLLDKFLTAFNMIYSKIKKGTKYRNRDLSFPPILYMFFKTEGIIANRYNYAEFFGITYNRFVKDMKCLIPFYPEFQNRDRKTVLISIIKDVASHFRLNQQYINNAKRIYKYFYRPLQFSSDEIGAGVVLVLAKIVSDVDTITMKQICERIGILSSSVAKKISDVIFPQLGIPFSYSIMKSANLLKESLLTHITFYC